jgi:AraC family transcriptional activator of tynA and feaB
VPLSQPIREPERWRVRGGNTADRLDSWAGILAATHLAFEVHPTYRTQGEFRGAVTRRAFGDLMLVDCTASPFLGHRSHAVIGVQGQDTHHHNVLGFQFVCKGVELVREGDRELALTSGDVVLWDGLQPTDVEIVEPFYKRTLLFPRDRVIGVCPRLAELSALPSLEGSGPARLLVRYMNALALELPTLEPAAGAAAASAALELLRAAVEPSLPTSRSAERTAMRAEVRRYVRTHLQDHGLGPASIARTYAISVRALHALFEDEDSSVAALVRSERLARCLEDLQRPNGGSVTDIAFRWGFCDAAHFSRLFKRAFDATPSEIRHAALVASTSAQNGKQRGAGELVGNGSPP